MTRPGQFDLVAAAREALPGLLEGRLAGPDLPPEGGEERELKLLPRGKPSHRTDGLFEVAFDVWTYYSRVRVEHEADTGELHAWTVDRLQRGGAGGLGIGSDEAAIELATAACGGLPGGARLARVDRDEMGPGEPFVRVTFGHFHEGIRVEDDFIQVHLNPSLRRAAHVRRFWRRGPFPEPDARGPDGGA